MTRIHQQVFCTGKEIPVSQFLKAFFLEFPMVRYPTKVLVPDHKPIGGLNQKYDIFHTMRRQEEVYGQLFLHYTMYQASET